MWTIYQCFAYDGALFYTVSASTDGDEIRFTVGTEAQARKLRDTLNLLGTAVTTFAL